MGQVKQKSPITYTRSAWYVVRYIQANTWGWSMEIVGSRTDHYAATNDWYHFENIIRVMNIGDGGERWDIGGGWRGCAVQEIQQ